MTDISSRIAVIVDEELLLSAFSPDVPEDAPDYFDSEDLRKAMFNTELRLTTLEEADAIEGIAPADFQQHLQQLRLGLDYLHSIEAQVTASDQLDKDQQQAEDLASEISRAAQAAGIQLPSPKDDDE